MTREKTLSELLDEHNEQRSRLQAHLEKTRLGQGFIMGLSFGLVLAVLTLVVAVAWR